MNQQTLQWAWRSVLGAPALLLLLGMLGCSSLEGDDRHEDRDHDRYGSPRGDERISWPADRGGELRVPRSAMVLDEGRGELSVRAEDRGVLYLYDVDDGRVVWSGPIGMGQRFTVDPEHDRAAIDGIIVYDRNLERKHEHRIYLEPR